eukprot:3039324-Pyramimonas_sp.AAC.1
MRCGSSGFCPAVMPQKHGVCGSLASLGRVRFFSARPIEERRGASCNKNTSTTPKEALEMNVRAMARLWS